MTFNLRDMRTQLLVAVGVLLLLCVAAIALLLSPAGRSRDAREQEYERLRLEKIEKTRAAGPVQGMDKKIATAREEEAQFNGERLAQRYSAMSEQLSRIATEAGVNVSNVKYDEHGDKGAPPGYDGVGITIRGAGQLSAGHALHQCGRKAEDDAADRRGQLWRDAGRHVGGLGSPVHISKECGMKAGAESKTKVRLAIVLGIVAILTVAWELKPSGEPAAESAPVAALRRKETPPQ